MRKSHGKRYLFINYKQIITYMCYATLIIGWNGFNCINSLDAASIDSLNENGKNNINNNDSELSILPSTLYALDIDGNQQAIYSNNSLIKAAVNTLKLDFVTTNTVENVPIQGWECYCWNSTNGYYEVK